MAPYEALYDGPYHSPTCWNKLRNGHHLGLNYIQETIEKVIVIHQNLTITQSHQNSYTNNRRRPLEFVVGDCVFLKIFPFKSKV